MISASKVILAMVSIILNENKPSFGSVNFTEPSSDDSTGGNVPYYVVRGKNKLTPLSSKMINYVFKAPTLNKGEAIIYPEDRAAAIELACKHGWVKPNDMLTALRACEKEKIAALVQFSSVTEPYTIGEGETSREVTNFSRVYSSETPKSVFLKDMDREGIVPVENDVEKEESAEIF